MAYKDTAKARQAAREYKARRRREDPAFAARLDQASNRSRAKRPDHYRRSKLNAKLRRTYGITLDDFDRMFENQEGLCAVCSRHMCLCRENCGTRAVVDHDHAKAGPDAIRGLLCNRCNRFLGAAGDSPRFFKNAALYLGALQCL